MMPGVLSKLGVVGKQLVGIGSKVNLVAVHSRQSRLSPELVEQWYVQAVQWMSSLGVEPKSFVSYGVSGFQEAKKYSFVDADKKLKNRGFNNIGNISLSAAPPVKAIYETDPHIEVGITSAQVDWNMSRIIWAWDKNYISLSSTLFVELLTRAQDLCGVDYAFATSIGYRDNPIVLSSLSAFDKKEKKGSAILVGGATKKIAYEQGIHAIDFLREIYPYQILGPTHLSYKVGSQALREWIESSESHGMLSEFSQEHWMWVIPQERLDAVRQTLITHNLLTSYLPNMGRILEDYGRPIE